MIQDLLAEGVLVATIGLVAMPLVSRRFRTAFSPTQLTRYNSVTMITGLALLLVALVACAVPVARAIAGVELPDRHFFPGDAIVGWVSAAVAFVVVGSFAIGYRRTRNLERILAVEPSLGIHIDRGDHELIILATAHSIAYAVGTRQHRQIVISEGLMAKLSVRELVAVVEHEAAHLRLGHRSDLALIAMVEPLSVVLAPLRRLTEVARAGLERAADAATSDHAATRSALLTLSGMNPHPGVAAFTSGDLADRVDALAIAETPNAALRAALYAVASTLAGVSAWTLVRFWFL
ncbi:MAG: M48 family metalloprotease [Acidimicrobiia bacterium]